MLQLSPNAGEAVDALLHSPGVPDDAGLRIGATQSSELELGIAPEPAPGDQVIEEGDARVFVDATVAPMLDDARLEAQTQGNQVAFALSPQDQPPGGPSPNGAGPAAA
jgi:Fe-S cluster assembly iron-binding protein IscA